MVKKSFSHKINDLIFSIITSGKVNIKLNDKLGTYFKTKRGVRQGDPLFPILFNLTVDSMSSLVKNAQENGLIRGLAPHLQENGFSILQYADDNIFMLEEGHENARNFKKNCCVFLNRCLDSK
jgi:hypothetical protein